MLERTERILLSEEGDVSILTDAKHECLRNAKDTNVVCIRNFTYKQGYPRGTNDVNGRSAHSDT